MLTKQIELLRQKLRRLPLGGIVEQFLDYLTVEAGLSANTVLAYGRDLLGFSEHCAGQEPDQLASIQPATVYSYLKKLSKAGQAENSISRCLVAIKMLLRFGILTGKLTNDITDRLETPKLWKKLPGIANKDQVFRLLAAPCPDDPYYLRDKAVLELLYATGARASEVADLMLKDVNLAVGYVRCFGKGRKERIVPLDHRLRQECLQVRRMPLLAAAFFPPTVEQGANGAGRIRRWRLGRILRIHPQKPFQLFYTLFQVGNLLFQLFYIGVFVHACIIGQRKPFTEIISTN